MRHFSAWQLVLALVPAAILFISNRVRTAESLIIGQIMEDYMSTWGTYAAILICALSTKPPVRGWPDQSITRLEQERSKAQVRGDVNKLNELLAPEFMEMNAAGQVRTKAQNIETHRTGETHWQAFELTDLRVQVHGNTAVVMGRLTRKGTSAGRDLSGRARYTRYYANRPGHWQTVFQYSVPDPE